MLFRQKLKRIEERSAEVEKLVEFFDFDYRDKVIMGKRIYELNILPPAVEDLKEQLDSFDT